MVTLGKDGLIYHNGEKIVKRVIALPGEHVEYKNGNLYIDGFIVKENFNHGETHDFMLESIGYKTIGGESIPTIFTCIIFFNFGFIGA